ncbi:hypothetical protein GCM10007908_26750 [Rhizobium albus]|nr:hypothetical protein GCM10007908_26750 [Rhizobium albus]
MPGILLRCGQATGSDQISENGVVDARPAIGHEGQLNDDAGRFQKRRWARVDLAERLGTLRCDRKTKTAPAQLSTLETTNPGCTIGVAARLSKGPNRNTTGKDY